MSAAWQWGDLAPLNYGVIMADPPWRFETWSDAGQNRKPDYDTMSVEEIADLRVADLARSDCLLALWAIDPMLDRAFEVIEAWGFRFVTVGFYWAKAVRDPLPAFAAVGQGDRTIDSLFPITKAHWTRNNPEICLFAVRGAPHRLSASVRKLIVAPRREASRKPDDAAERLEQLVRGPYCELFSRAGRPGWDAWGNQTGKFDKEKADG